MVTRPKSVESKSPKLVHDSLKPLLPLRLVLPTRHMSGSVAYPIGAQGQLSRHIITLYRVTVISPPPLALSPAHLEAPRRTRNRNHTISCDLPGGDWHGDAQSLSPCFWSFLPSPLDMELPRQIKRGRQGLLPLYLDPLSSGNTQETQL